MKFILVRGSLKIVGNSRFELANLEGTQFRSSDSELQNLESASRVRKVELATLTRKIKQASDL